MLRYCHSTLMLVIFVCFTFFFISHSAEILLGRPIIFCSHFRILASIVWLSGNLKAFVNLPPTFTPSVIPRCTALIPQRRCYRGMRRSGTIAVFLYLSHLFIKILLLFHCYFLSHVWISFQSFVFLESFMHSGATCIMSTGVIVYLSDVKW